MMGSRLILLFIFASVSAHSTKIDVLKKYFNDGQSRAYLVKNQPLLDDQGFDEVSKRVYRNFLKTSSFAQPHRLDDYFKQWVQVDSFDGPFVQSTQNNALKSLENAKNFFFAILYDAMINNRDNDVQVKQAIKNVIFSKEAVKVKTYYTGDDDIISGFVLASQHKDGSLYLITVISD